MKPDLATRKGTPTPSAEREIKLLPRLIRVAHRTLASSCCTEMRHECSECVGPSGVFAELSAVLPFGVVWSSWWFGTNGSAISPVDILRCSRLAPCSRPAGIVLRQTTSDEPKNAWFVVTLGRMSFVWPFASLSRASQGKWDRRG